MKQCGSGGRKHRDAEDVCQESRPCKSSKKKRAKSCDKNKRGQESGGDLQDMCIKQAALDCARRLKELQKQWEAVARAAARAEAAALQAGGSKRGSGCPVKPPAKPDEKGSSFGLAYFLYSQRQGEGGEGNESEDKDKGKEEGKIED